MASRKDRHREIIKQISMHPDMKVIQFHTAQKMPRGLRGTPDLNIQFRGVNFWIEIKPRYANYMRDQMSDVQWEWFHERYTADAFGDSNRYAICCDAQEIENVIRFHVPDVHMPKYFWDRYEKWRRAR